jgi:putative ABC transport system permease protein
VAVSVRFHEVVGNVVLLVMFAVVAAAVANPVLMSVLERTREFGILLAVGMRPGAVLGLVLVESMLLGAAGLLVGNLLGLGVTGWFARTGIDVGAFEAGMRTMPGLSDVVAPVLRPERSATLSALVFVVACATAAYPAAKAARLDPVQAIRGTAHGSGRAWLRVVDRVRGPLFVRIAIRSLLRNGRRTAIMTAGAASAILGYVFLLSFFDGFFDQAIENSTRYLTGHVQIERPGFRHDLAPDMSIDEPRTLIERLRRLPGVAGVAPRVQAQALVSTAAKSEGVVLVGIDAAAERGVTFIDRTIVDGRMLAAGGDREIVVGRRLADKLRLALGQRVVMMAQAADGELGTAAFRVRGIFSTESAAFDEGFVFVTLPAAQSLLSLGARVSTVNVRVADRARIPSILGTIRAQPEAGGLVAVGWQELLPQLDEMVRFNRVVSGILLAVLLVVVASALTNAVYMAVAERTREFGVMVALGTPPAAVGRMVVYETALTLSLALSLGYSLGVGAVAYFGAVGIDLSDFFRGYSTIPGLTGVVSPRLFAASIVPPGVALLVVGVVVSVLPARRAALLDPTRAIRHV